MSSPHTPAKEQPVETAEHKSTDWRQLVLVGLIAFLPRLIAWIWVARAHMPAHGDEQNYWAMAQAIQRRDWSDAYDQGIWPPLEPALLSLAPTLELARFINMILASATVFPIFLLAKRLAGSRAGIFAAVMFSLYPVFIGFSHLLWSECIFTLLLATGAYFFVLHCDGDSPGGALVVGICLGLMGLTRSSVMLYAVGFAALLFMAHRRRSAVLALGVAALMWAPWLLCLYRAEGRVVMFSTANGYNFYWGNNPYLPLVEDPAHDRLNLPNCRAYYQHLHEINGGKTIRELDVVAQAEAIKFIEQHPLGFVKRMGAKTLDLWANDWFVRRHYNLGLYPPFPAAQTILSIGDVGHYVILFGGLAGVSLLRRQRSLFVMILLAGTILPIVGPSQTRYNLPMLMMLTVPCGAALVWALDAIRNKGSLGLRT